MARFIDSPKYPGRRAANCADMLALFGVTTGKWPDAGFPVRFIQGIAVHVLPVDHVSLRKQIHPLTGRPRKSSKHRVIAACPDCGRAMGFSRLPQHVCKQAGGPTPSELRTTVHPDDVEGYTS